jgi:hypothetical protein
MKEIKGEKIIQIVAAAPGWYAMYKQDDNSISYSPIACWALVQDEQGYLGIEGYDGMEYISRAAENSNFEGYKGPDHKPE